MIETIYLEECKEKHWECKNLSDVVGDSTDLVSKIQDLQSRKIDSLKTFEIPCWNQRMFKTKLSNSTEQIQVYYCWTSTVDIS